MQKIWLFIQDQSVFVYVIAGLTVLGVFTRLLLQGKLHRLLKASENMALTKERNLKTIRNHYENNLNMDLQVTQIDAFIEKYIFKLKFGGVPIHIWNSLNLECMILSIATAGIGIVYAIGNSYPEMFIGRILIAAVVSGAILMTMENLFRLELFYERMEANIADYLDNNLKSRLGRPLIKRRERGADADPMTASQNERLIAVASEIAGQLRGQQDIAADRAGTGCGGRDTVRLKPEAVPEKMTVEDKKPRTTELCSLDAVREIAAGQEDLPRRASGRQAEYDADVIAEVLRSFFAG